MARPTWTGFVSFGLVTIPIEMHRATSPRTLHFHQLHAGTSHRIRYRKVDEVSGEEVSSAEIVNGFPTEEGDYVVIDPEDLRANASPRSQAIEIQDFVSLAEIDPIQFAQSYYLRPRGRGTERAYVLLVHALEATDKVGIATFVLREAEHLVAIRANGGALIAQTMYFAEEIVPAADLGLPASDAAEVDRRELDAAIDLIGALSTTWDPARYENTHRAELLALIERKREGHTISAAPEARPESNVVDLLTALEESVAASGHAPARRRAAARSPRARTRPPRKKAS
jgi:DNA end-binding protein Ku